MLYSRECRFADPPDRMGLRCSSMALLWGIRSAKAIIVMKHPSPLRGGKFWPSIGT